jgi:amidase
VGLKPSRGRISMAPDVGESWMGSTTDGALTRTVRDAAAMLDVMAGYEPGDPYTASPFARPLVDEVGVDPGPLRVGVLDHPVLGAPGHPECADAANEAARMLESLGHSVEVRWPEAIGDSDFPAHFRTIVATWTANDIAIIESVIGRPPGEGDMEHANLALAEIGRSVSGAQYVAAMLEVHRWCRRVVSWWGEFDLLVTPTLATPPPPIGYLSEPGQGRRLAELLQYTAQFNVTGQPAISLPLHMTPDGLPVGVQLVAAAGREDLLVRVASQLEQALPWADRVPPVHA